MKRRVLTWWVLALGAVVLAAQPASAETTEIRIARQYGLAYLQMMVMEDQQIVEKHARAAGLGDVKVTWGTFRSSDVMNDALLSDSLDFGCLGIPGIATIWSRTRGTPVEVRAASGFNLAPLVLTTRDPAIKSLKDYTDKQRIALPAVKVSMQAILLQMAAAKLYGEANYTRFDPLTVSMTHPDAMAALLSGAGEITSHFASPPFIQRELESPNVSKVVTSTEILGGPISFNVVATTKRFHDANPKAYAAFLGALQEATDRINADKRAAAEIYVRMTKDKSGVDGILKIMNDGIEYTLVPKNVMQMVEFMHKAGSIKTRPETWKDLFFPSAHAYAGS